MKFEGVLVIIFTQGGRTSTLRMAKNVPELYYNTFNFANRKVKVFRPLVKL